MNFKDVYGKANDSLHADRARIGELETDEKIPDKKAPGGKHLFAGASLAAACILLCTVLAVPHRTKNGMPQTEESAEEAAVAGEITDYATENGGYRAFAAVKESEDCADAEETYLASCGLAEEDLLFPGMTIRSVSRDETKEVYVMSDGTGTLTVTVTKEAAKKEAAKKSVRITEIQRQGIRLAVEAEGVGGEALQEYIRKLESA